MAYLRGFGKQLLQLAVILFLLFTSNQSFAQDADGDGIVNNLDVDDDNDGVLDALESNCSASLMPKTGVIVSSPATWTYYNGATSLQGLVDGLDGMSFSASTAATFTNQTIFQFDLPVATILTEIELGNYPGQTALLAGGTFKMQGWNGTQWVDIGGQQVIANTTPVNASNNSIKFNMENNLLAYTKYRIFGISASGSQSANELYFTQKICTDIDTDGDGISNRLDLDSDGDACADAIEASSSTTATSTSVYPTGTDTNSNGLLNNYEGTAYGTLNYTSKYSDYATNNFINMCTDTDGDGVPDFIDLDDDNDGVLDTAEMTACNTITTPTAATGTPNWPGSPPSLTIDNSGMSGTGLSAVHSVPNLLADSYYMTEPLTKGFLEYTLPANTSLGGVVLWAPDANNYGGGDGPVKDFRVEVIYSNAVTYTSQTFTTAQPIGANSNPGAQVFYLGQSFANPQKVRLNILSGWYDINNNNTIQVGTETIPTGTIAFNYNMTLCEFKVICGPDDLDTDSDGIPNRLDLDSDNDGCSDAKEAGTTTSATANYAHPAPYGTNGFANSLETTADNGIYSGTYTYNFASNATLNACIDTDSDGVVDVVDLDDDNDGVLDETELACAEQITSKVGVIVTKPATINYSFNSNTLANLVDGVDANVYVISAPTGTLTNSPLLNFEFPTPIALSYLEIGHYVGQTLFSATSTYKIQGSTNNTTWTDVTGTLTYNNVATSTSGGLSTNNSNIANFPTNTTAYKYYRVFGINAATGGGWATEVYFKQNNCSWDIDNDGIVNSLDLDSDGDGCSDAIEASSSTTATSTTVYPTGTDTNTNGLLNNYEGTTAGTVNYTSTYTNYALLNTVNACLDTDSDGIKDVIDIDDDNDGVPDSKECGSCFIGNAINELVSPSAIVTIPVNNLTTISSTYAFNGSGLSAVPTTEASLSSITHSSPTLTSNAAYLVDGSGMSNDWKFTLAAPADIKGMALWIPGSTAYGGGDAPMKKFIVSWTDCTSGLTKSQTFDLGVPSPVAKVVYFDEPVTNVSEFTFDLLEVWFDQQMDQGVSNGWEVATPATIPYNFNVTLGEIRFITQSADYSMFCSTDTDGDGIPNHLDLDSDGDNCSDAKEAGTTTSAAANYAHPAPYGTNGLADALETTAGSGIYNGTYSYNIAISNALNGCLDTDNDGVGDIIDIDDDNDGILDDEECYESCTTPIINGGFESNVIPLATVTILAQELVPGWSTSNDNFIELWGSGYTSVPAAEGNAHAELNAYTVTTFYQKLCVPPGSTINWSVKHRGRDGVDVAHVQLGGSLATAVTQAVMSDGNTAWGTYTGTYNIPANQPSTYIAFKSITPTGSTGNFIDDVQITIVQNLVCDTDGDGIVNALDLDSDGDGCSDAIEGGSSSTATSTSVYPSGTDANANGLLDSYESSAAGSVNYASTYSNYSLSIDNNACLDSDNDGIKDLVDIDDDNDGVLDAVESPTCFYQINEVNSGNKSSLVKVSSQLEIVKNDVFEVLTDGVGGATADNVEFINTPVQAQLNKELLKFQFNSATQLDAFYIQKASATELFAATGASLKVQGSNNNSTWTDLTAAIALPANATNVTVNGGISLTNSNKFTLTTNLAKYTHYRILGVAAGNVLAGQATEVYFDINSSSFQSSSYPKPNCINDTDADGQANHLDLDSDGDGCSDAKEAGTTTSATANYAHPAPYGTNGLADALETAAGSGVYSGAYSYAIAISNALNGCLDTDNDGVGDLADIDDDNDGILDAVESPTCFYTALELAKPIAVSTELAPYSTNAITNSIDNSATSYSAFDPNVNWVNKEIFKFTAVDYIGITGISFDLVSWPLSASAAMTFKLQGSSDNITWSDLSPAVSSTANTGTFTIANTLATTSKFKYYRLLGVAGTSYYGGVTNALFNLATNTIPSGSPKATCSNDTDGDGIVNHLDLDSDGDGCADAIEASSSTTATSTSVYPTGTDINTNGLLNNYESATAGVINYASTYAAYALINTINACTDTDGDGVKDLADIDDDNDGVLDAVESPTCFYTALELAKPIAVSTELAPYSTNAITNSIDNSATSYSAFDPYVNWVNKEIFKFTAVDYIGITGISFDLFNWALSSSAAMTFKLQGSSDDITWTDLSPAVSSTATTGTFTIANTLATTSKFKYYRLLGVAGTSYYGGVYNALFNLTTNTVPSGSPKPTCSNDTDGDNIVNHLDLDSDGDGCSDAKEAGTTTSAAANYVHPAPYGTNGLADALETAAGSGIYNGTYSYTIAISNTLNGCLDTDNDGVGDLIDLDDDNDGVLDVTELACTEQITSKVGVIVTKPAAINYTFNGNTIANLIDGVDANVVVISAPTGTLTNSPLLNFEFPTPIALSYLEIGHYQNQLLFALTSTYKIQGSTDNTTWTDVTGTLTYNNVATSTSGGLSTHNSNIANFPTNTNAYKYYRVFGINAAVGSGWATEVYFKQNNCSWDIDNDGIVNSLDLDSDGDGCSDAIEASSSTTATSTSIYPTGTDTNTNGILNNYEGTTAGTVNYTTSTYIEYALINTINACTDTDNDGIKDIIDIDDDNDGVPDSKECGGCFTGNAINELVSPTAIVTIPINKFGGVTTSNRAFDGSGLSATPTTIASLSTITHSSPTLISNAAYTDDGAGMSDDWKFTLAAPTDIKGIALWIPGSTAYGGGDAPMKKFIVSWTDCTTGLAKSQTFDLGVPSSAAKTIYFVEPVANVSEFTFNLLEVWFDQQMDQGVSNGWEIATPATIPNNFNVTLGEIRFITQSADYSMFCSTDTDGDGIPNRLDLDSDNDGCSDAKEAGSSTTATSTSVYPTGTDTNTNGLLNNYESATAGTVNYTSTYTTYALSSNLNLCLDTDGDGIGNLIDIDDDNDGVLDAAENNCTTSIMSKTGVSVSSTVTWGGTLANILDGTEAIAAYTTTTFLNQTILQFDLPAAKVLSLIELSSQAGNFPLGSTGTYNIQGWNGTTWSIIATNQVLGTSTPITGSSNSYKFNMPNNYTAYSKYRIYGTSVSGTISGWALEAYFTERSCNPDSDGDGIPNSLELDSDNDGCADAIEAGSSTTATSTSVYPTGTDSNSNGLLNTYESATAGAVNYSSTYLNYALNGTVNACLDTDGDGIGDLLDLDDDNDGILDTVEYNCSPALMSKTGVSVSSTVTWGGTLSNILNGIEAIDAYTTTTFLNQTILQFDLPTAKALSLIELSSQAGTIPLGSTGTYNIEGWNGTIWNTIAANQVFGTSAPITGTSNSYKFSMPNNYTAYSKYRIFGTSVSGTISGWVQEAYFTERSCNPDIDGDGIPNSLDLDSDNDACSDAFEAGSSTTATSTSVYPTGTDTNTNGLLNNYEGGVAGTVNYSSTYTNYALVSTINACTDSDNDGITDLIDTDDDNDGILDNLECPLAQLNTNESNGTFGTAAAPRNLANTTVTGGYVYSASNGGPSQYAVVNQSTPYHPDASFWRYVGHTTGTANDAYLAVNGNTTVGNFYSESVTLQAGAKYRISFWHQAASVANAYELAAEVLSSSNAVLATANTGAQNSLGWKLATVDYTSTSDQTVTFIIKNVSTNASGNDFSIDDISFTAIGCPDSDLDGIPNQLDTDSDNDGCSDANEAYNTTTAQGTDGNMYYGTGNPPATNANGSVTAATYPGTNANVLTVGTASTITSQPANQSVTAGTTATFTATVTPGSGTTTYQWQVSTNSGATWTNVTNSSTYTGATTTTLSVANTTLAMSGYQYQLLISQSNYICGNITTVPATLTIGGLIQIVNDNASTLEDTPLNGSVTLNDIGSGGSIVTVNTFTINGTTYNAGQTAVIAGVGTIVINSDGTYTFTPASNFNGNVPTISYSATDGNASTGNGLLAIVVTAVNDKPIVDNEVLTTNEDTPATGDLTDAGDSDPDGTPLTANTTPVSGPSNGTIVINPDGTYTYTPNPNFNGTDVVVVSICDAGTPGVICINDTINITVNAVNDAPIVDNEVVTTNEDTPATGDLTDAGDSDPDGTPLTVNTTPVSGPTNGTIVINPDGTYTYTPNANFNGTDVVVVSICDAGTPGIICVNDTITITVTAVNDAPIVDNETITTNEDTPSTGDLTDAGDSDPDGTPLTANTTPVSGPTNGTIVINTDGTYTYTPNVNFNGVDTIVVSVCDTGIPLPGVCVNDTITVTVAPVNDAPIVDNEVVTTNEDTPLTGDLTDAGDSDPDGTPLTANTTPVSGPSNGTIVINANGTYTYTPNANFSGTDVIVVSICDAGTPGIICVNDTIFITVTAVNDAPIVDNETITTNEDTPATGDLTDAGDLDPEGTPLTANTTPVSGPSNGTIVINANGTYTYTPNANFNGTDVIVVSICDAGLPLPAVCVNDTITITVTAVNDAPIVDNETITTNEDTPATGDLTDAGDSDPDGTPLTANTTPVSGPSNGTIVINANGTYTYTPNANFNGTDVIVVSICDAGLPLPGICVNDTIFITVTAVNDAPIVDNEIITTNENTPATGDLTDAGDSDPDGTPLTANTTPVSGPSNGTIVINPDGTYTYTPNPGFSGTDVIVVSICDAGLPLPGVCVNDTITVTVLTVTETNPDMNVTSLNIPVSGNLVTNDDVPVGTTYGTPIGNPSNPAGGTIAMNPDGTYTFTGTNTGVYTYNVPVCAPGQTTNCPTEELIITVLDPNSTTNNPINNTDLATSTTTTPVVINGLSNDASGNTGGSLNPGSLTITDAPNHGTATVNPSTGAVTYTANAGFVGTDTLVYQVCDNSSPTPLCGTAMQIITILPANGVNDGPAASDDYMSEEGTTPATGNVLINDTDPEGNTLNVTPQTTTIPGKGTLVLNTDGTYTFTPVPGFTGTVDIPYTACDNGIPQVCTQATLYITYRVSNTPLYVNLFSFKAKSNGCNIDLVWEAKNEVNFSRYEILRKVEGSSDFVKIAEINSKATDDKLVTYNYSDKELRSFKRYEYKLKMVDMDSKYSFSKTEWIKLDCSPKEEIFVYPNPIRGNELYIDLYNEIGTDYKFILVDMTGRKILESSKTLNNERETVTLSTHHIAAGVYHLLVETPQSSAISYKIIKE